MKIYLDDLRDTPEGFTLAKNFVAFKHVLEEALGRDEEIEAISFDNDLGEGEKEGYEIMKWLSKTRPELLVGATEITVHSANPDGRKNMEQFLEFCRRNRKELLEMKNREDPWGELKIK